MVWPYVSQFERSWASQVINSAARHAGRALACPVKMAFVPATADCYQPLSTTALQRVLLRVMRELITVGNRKCIVAMRPGHSDSVRSPLAEALSMQPASLLHMKGVEQPKPTGLCDAILQADTLVGKRPFRVALPEDFLSQAQAAG